MSPLRSFLVTGASSGLGLCIALAALHAGHRVTGTARNVSQATEKHPELAAAGGKWLQLDVTSTETSQIVSKCIESEDIDVLINNAGYGLYGALEDMRSACTITDDADTPHPAELLLPHFTLTKQHLHSESEIRQQMEVNFFGTLKVTKAAIPYFRTRRRGTIVNMSSIAGLTVTSASGIMYGASKFAIEAISEGLVLQLASFGIRVIVVEPGLFRTNWLAGSYVTPAAGLGKEYEDGPVGEALRVYPTMHQSQQGDPQKAAERVVEVVCGTGMASAGEVGRCLRVPLGKDAMEKARDKVAGLTRELDIVGEIAGSTTHDDVRSRKI